MTDFWDDARNQEIEPPPERPNLPIKTWVIARTANSENGGWAPTVRTQTKKADQSTFYKFNMGLLTVGGDAKIEPGHLGRYVGLDRFVHPGEKEPANMPCAGALLGALTAMLCPGEGDSLVPADAKGDARQAALKARANARKNKLFGLLKAKAESLQWSAEAFKGDGALFIASTAATLLKEGDPRYVLAFIDEDKNRETGEVRGVRVAQVLDYTKKNVEEKKVVPGPECPPPYGDAVVATF